MSASLSTSDKGKARAIDTNDHPSIRLVKPRPIPSASLLNIEYPGILSNDAVSSASSSSSSNLPQSSLERALSTLHPSALPPLTSSPLEALNWLSRIPNEGLKVVECRLGGFASNDSHNTDQVYKAPLIGEAVPTHNVVVRIVKRTWRQKKRKRASTPAHQAQVDDMMLDPALFTDEPRQPNGHDQADRYTGRVKKEYCVEVLGLATNTVRFRSMADFAFQPEIANGTQLDPVMALHKALATMDLKSLQTFTVPEQLEDYQLAASTPGGLPKSNLHMVPPAFFSRIDVPFHYAFQQTPYSELRTVPIPPHSRSNRVSFAHALARAHLPPGQMQRFVNRVRLSNITPQPFRVGRDSKVPTQPQKDVVKIEHRCDPRIVARLRQLLQQRPMWSRVAIKNQLTEDEVNELNGSNEKVYYALSGYSMVGGPWRDTMVRFGYDVRADMASRVYQRVFLRGTGARLRTPGKGDEDQDDDDQVARSSVVPVLHERTRTTHLFDGTTLHRNVGNFQLCDVQDPLIAPYISRLNDADLPHAERIGTPWLREHWDAETGWYTRRAIDLIRALITARFKALAETGKPLESGALDGIVARIRHKWREEDAISVGEGASLQRNDAHQTSVHGEPSLV